MTSIRRFFVIFQTLFPAFLSYALTRNKPESKKYKEAILAIRLAFQKLGPTYIKFGQMLSARPDLVGYNLAAELRNLLDHEPHIPFETVEKIVEEELKQPVKKVFKKIEEEPLATASIGQTHKATFRNGHIVVIKVQRPGIQKIIQDDLPVLRTVTKTMDIILSSKGLKFSYIYSQFTEWITHELDFQIEGHRSEKIRENMDGIDGVTIPKIYWKYSTPKLLTMEYIEGHTINYLLEEMQKQQVKTLYDLKLDHAIDPDLLIKRVIHAVAKQTLVDKFFHGDLHPANIIVSKHNSIGFVDFGIVGSLNEEEHTQILMAMLAIVEGDPEALVKVISSLIADPMTAEELSTMHQSFSDELHKLHEDVGGKITLNHALTMLFPLSEKYHVMWSAGFLLAAKTIAQIDTVAQLIGLRTSLVELMKPEVEKALTLSFPDNFTKETLYKNLVDIVQAGKKLPQTLTEFEDLIHASSFMKSQQTTPKQTNFLKHPFFIGFAAVLVAPFLSPRIVPPQILFILLPLLFIVILVKIFTIGRK